MTTESTRAPKLDLSAVPEYIRENVGRALLPGFLEAIRDPEKKRMFDELGRAFLERRGKSVADRRLRASDPQDSPPETRDRA